MRKASNPLELEEHGPSMPQKRSASSSNAVEPRSKPLRTVKNTRGSIPASFRICWHSALQAAAAAATTAEDEEHTFHLNFPRRTSLRYWKK